MSFSVSIVPYNDSHHSEFRALNLEWLDKYGLREPPDVLVLENPRSQVIDKGGFIWVALIDGKVVGTSALQKEHDGVYELAKMCVSGDWQGKGISKLLIEVCLEKAKQINASKVELFSNSQLKAALKLYEQYGFRYVDVKDSPFVTADIKMEINY
ncbi:MAG: GNAT family N-acetyltransferase [Chryseolinea sp.]